MPPLERHPLLRPLSRDHHQGLLLCWRIRRELARPTGHERMLEECRAFFHSDLLLHFAVEEEAVFPVLGADHPAVHRAVLEHRRLSRLFLQTEDALHALSLIEDELEAHIRFEERVLFPAIQEAATDEELGRIDRLHGVLTDDPDDRLRTAPSLRPAR